MEIKSEISNLASNFLNKNFSIKTDNIEIQKTKKDFVGDITIVLFPYLKIIDQDKSDFGEAFKQKRAELGPNTTSALSISSLINGYEFPYPIKKVGSI